MPGQHGGGHGFDAVVPHVGVAHARVEAGGSAAIWASHMRWSQARPGRKTSVGRGMRALSGTLEGQSGASMTASTDLILIRHGETDWNRELRFQGHIDVPLNDTGHEQARRLGLRLARESVEHIVCSDLMRTQQTAAPAAQQLGLQVVTTVSLREQSFGVAEGLNADEVRSQHPRAWEDWLRFQADHGMAGGETPRQFHVRVMAALGDIAGRHAGRTVLVITHGGVLDMVWRSARSLGLDGPAPQRDPQCGHQPHPHRRRGAAGAHRGGRMGRRRPTCGTCRRSPPMTSRGTCCAEAKA